MNPKILRKFVIPSVVIVFSFLFILRPSWGLLRVKLEAGRQTEWLEINQKAVPHHTLFALRAGRQMEIPKNIEEIARRSGIERILSIQSNTSSKVLESKIDWEGSLKSSLQFVNNLTTQIGGKCVKLKFSKPSAGSALIRGEGVFWPANQSHSANNITTPLMASLSRDVFSSSQNSFRAREIFVQKSKPRKENSFLVEKLEKLKIEEKEREEITRLETQKNNLETNLLVTGIVNNGRQPTAYINSKMSQRGLVAIVPGDMIEGARVISIDDKSGEVRLDLEGKREIRLRISNSALSN